eukprot:357811-Chlamydomonas_euryale.AAC.11
MHPRTRAGLGTSQTGVQVAHVYAQPGLILTLQLTRWHACWVVCGGDISTYTCRMPWHAWPPPW